MDYLISPHKALQNIMKFSVGEYFPSISDHCSICATIYMKAPLKKLNIVETTLKTLPERYLWNDSSKTRFYVSSQQSYSKDKSVK